MPVTPLKLFEPAQLTNDSVSYYTAPAGVRAIIKKLTFTNTDLSAQTVFVFLNPAGVPGNTSNTLVFGKSIAAGDTWECFFAEGHVLSPGDSISAKCSALAAVNIQGSGVEIQ